MPEEEPESNKQVIAPEDKVPVKEKAAYGAGGVGVGIQEYADNGLMGPIFVVGVGISPAIMGICTIFYRAWDAISDATMGWVTDNTRTKYGRRRPYLFLGAILMAIVMPLMFMFGREWSLAGIIAWMFVFQILLTTTQTIYNIPYQCLAIEMTPDSNERTSLMAWRGYFGQIVMLVAGWTWWLCLLPPFRTDGEPDPVKGAPWVIGGLAIIACVLGLLPAFFAKERDYEVAREQPKISIAKSIKATFKNQAFLLILGFILIGVIGGGLTGVMGFYLRLYYACGGSQDLAAHIGGVESVVRIFISYLGIWIFQWLALRTSKRVTLMLSGAVLILAAIATYFCYTPEAPYLSIVPILLMAFSQAGLWMMVLSMIGDIVDDDELHTHTRREGAYSSVFSWVQKVTYSLIGGVSGFLVVSAGFDSSNRETMSPEAIENMRWMMVAIPSVMMGIGLALLYFYPLTNRRIRETRRELEARRKEHLAPEL